MMYKAYRALTHMLTPAARVWLRAHPRHRAAHARLAPPLPAFDTPPIVVHACSVGEYNTALPLLRGLRSGLPEQPLLLTVTTPAAYALALEKSPDLPMTWFPLDLPGAVSHFLDGLRPRALVQVETEIWPNIFVAAQERGIPVVIVNGRISDKHFPRYLRFQRALRPVMQAVRAVGAQNKLYADRFIALGCPAENVRITGNMKFESAAANIDPDRLAAFRATFGLDEGAGPVVVFGSTRPGDEALAARCWASLRERFPGARMIVAPRHPQRADEAAGALQGIPHLRRSALLAGGAHGREQVLLLDTLGELALAYACADVAVVGGSFYPGVNGHNPLEPAAQGIPVLFGPYMANFDEAARALLDADAAMQVPSPEQLAQELTALLGDARRRETLAHGARSVISQGAGATRRNVELILDTIARE